MTSTAPPVRVCLVGYGSIARVHEHVLQSRPDASLKAVVSRQPSAVPREMLWFDSLERMLDADVADLAVLCTPNGLHAEQALSCLRAGRHVVVEKPLTMDLHDGARVIDEADRRDLLLTVISQRRFEPAVQAVKDVISSGSLGRPLLGETLIRWCREQSYYDEIGWRGSRTLDGGVLMNQGIHAVDLLRWLLGDVATVNGHVATLVREIEAEDTSVACMRFTSGALGVVSATTATSPGLPAEINIFFEHGSVSLADDRIVRWEVPGHSRPTVAYDTGSGSRAAKNITAVGHARQWDDILSALRHNRPPAVTGRDALGTAALVLAIQRSSATGRPVEVQRQ